MRSVSGLHGLIVVAVIVAALAAVAGAFDGRRSGTPSTARAPRSRSAEPAAAAAAYRFPLGCLGAAIATPSGADPTGRLSHTGPCWRYGVYLTAILRKVDGVWRLALHASSVSCPITSLPASIRAQIVLCTKPVTPAARRPRSRRRP